MVNELSYLSHNGGIAWGGRCTRLLRMIEMRTRAIGTEERAETVVPSAPSGNVYLALVHLGRKIGANRRDAPVRERVYRRTSRGGRRFRSSCSSRWVSATDAGIQPRGRLDGCGIEVRLLEKLVYTGHDFTDRG